MRFADGEAECPAQASLRGKICGEANEFAIRCRVVWPSHNNVSARCGHRTAKYQDRRSVRGALAFDPPDNAGIRALGDQAQVAVVSGKGAVPQRIPGLERRLSDRFEPLHQAPTGLDHLDDAA